LAGATSPSPDKDPIAQSKVLSGCFV
jgi:hypothetical protein